jgi:hypothetical protein
MSMNSFRSLLAGLVVGVLVTFGFLLLGSSSISLASPGGRAAVITPVSALPQGNAVNHAPLGDEIPPVGLTAIISPAVLPTPIPGETLVYFAPSDSEATGTVIDLYNTDSVAHTVVIHGFVSGGAYTTWNFPVPSAGLVHISSDSVVSSPPPSWSGTNFYVANFTDFTTIVSVSLPKGVKVDGYIFFNPGTGTVDPRMDQGAIPLRFSTDPASMYLPSVQSIH